METLIAERPDYVLKHVNLAGEHLLVHSLHNAHSVREIFDLNGTLVRPIQNPPLATVSEISANPFAHHAFISVESYTLQPTIFHLTIPSGHLEVRDQIKYPLKTADFETQQLFFPAKDGTRLSMFIVRGKKAQETGHNPTLMYGYGAWGESEVPGFYPSLYPWLEAGGTYALVHVRGGGEYGRTWQNGGRQKNKPNSFDDFNTAAEYLIRNNYTNPNRLAIRGSSFGGLLVAGAMIRRPNLYKAVLCDVPLLDMLRYHLYSIGKNWIDEFGTEPLLPSPRVSCKVLSLLLFSFFPLLLLESYLLDPHRVPRDNVCFHQSTFRPWFLEIATRVLISRWTEAEFRVRLAPV